MTEPIEYAVRAGLGSLCLDDGKVNAMNLAWLERMQAALDLAEADDSRALLLMGRPGCFSAGLDFKALSALAPEDIKQTTDLFLAAMKRVFLFPKPVIAASTGHAVAGGMMLFLAADIRLAARDETSRYGLNEATTGVPFLGGTLGICQYGIPARHHTELILQGRMIDAAGCRERGIIEEIVEPEGLLEHAAKRAEALGDLDLGVYAINKLLLRQDVYDAGVRKAKAMIGLAPKGNVFSAMGKPEEPGESP